MTHGDGTHGAEYPFDVVLRGYDRRQVADHLASLEGRLAATSGQCNELRMQRDAAASRVHELEQRINGTGGGNAVRGGGSSAPGQPPPVSESASLDGLGAKVEAILRLATDEAAAIRRSAQDSTRLHTQAEAKLRTTFESIAERLGPLVERLNKEAKEAHSALSGATSRAETLETTAQQQARLLTEAAAADAARLRAEAQARVEISTRHVTDVREELALVKQIVTSLGAPSAGDSAAGAKPAASQGRDEQAAAGTSRSAQSPDAPTETIALPPRDPSRQGAGTRSGQPASRPTQPPT